MIKALCDLNEKLVREKADYPKYRQSRIRVSSVIVISPEGDLLDIVSLSSEIDDGKKKRIIQPVKIVPFQGTRTSGKSAYFLCDKADYILGINPEKECVTDEEFELSASLHEKIIGENCSECATAILKFYRKWIPKTAYDNPLIKNYADFSGMMVFRVDRMDVLDDVSLWNCWYKYYDERLQNVERCSILGTIGPAGQIHPKIKNIAGGASMGSSFVSFNNRVFESYGMEGNQNARMSDYAVYAYSSALNYLLSNPASRIVIGGSTFVFWAENGNEKYSQFFMSLFDPSNERLMDEENINIRLSQIKHGLPIDYENEKLSTDSDFHILGIAPNNGRLSVTFFSHNSFGKLISNIISHYERLAIVGVEKPIPPNLILGQTLLPGKKFSDIPSWMSSEFITSILNNSRYPESLYSGILTRIFADGIVSGIRVAMIKAYLQKNSNNPKIKEVSIVKLNYQTTYQPYVLGRLFAVLERIQNASNKTSTIKDSYFDSACATPSIAFPSALLLANKHLKNIQRDKPGLANYFERMVEEIVALLEDTFPNHLSLEEQGTFILGYYHQINSMNTKKEE